jgi:hypothetical protein
MKVTDRRQTQTLIRESTPQRQHSNFQTEYNIWSRVPEWTYWLTDWLTVCRNMTLTFEKTVSDSKWLCVWVRGCACVCARACVCMLLVMLYKILITTVLCFMYICFFSFTLMLNLCPWALESARKQIRNELNYYSESTYFVHLKFARHNTSI